MNANRLRPRLKLRTVLQRASAPLVLAFMASVLALGAPAQAAGVPAFGFEAVQWTGGVGERREGNRYQERYFSTDALNRLQDRIDWAQSRGALSAREANSLQHRAEDLRNRARAYWRSRGVDWQERRDLDGRFQDLREEVRHLVWDREYRGQYRQEWRERSLWGENGWRGDSGRRTSGANGPNLKRSEFEGDEFDVGAPETGRTGLQAAPKSYSPAPSLAPKAPAPKPVAPKAPAPAQTNRDSQPFQDGRDFH